MSKVKMGSLAAAVLAAGVAATAQASVVLTIGPSHPGFQNREVVLKNVGGQLVPQNSTYVAADGDIILGALMVPAGQPGTAGLPPQYLEGMILHKVSTVGAPAGYLNLVPVSTTDLGLNVMDVDASTFKLGSYFAVDSTYGDVPVLELHQTNGFFGSIDSNLNLRTVLNGIDGGGLYASLGMQSVIGAGNVATAAGWEYASVSGNAVNSYGGLNVYVNNTGLGFVGTHTNYTPIGSGLNPLSKTSVGIESKIGANVNPANGQQIGVWPLQSSDPVTYFAVPTPTALMGGMGLLGSVAVASLRKRRQQQD